MYEISSFWHGRYKFTSIIRFSFWLFARYIPSCPLSIVNPLRGSPKRPYLTRIVSNLGLKLRNRGTTARGTSYCTAEYPAWIVILLHTDCMLNDNTRYCRNGVILDGTMSCLRIYGNRAGRNRAPWEKRATLAAHACELWHWLGLGLFRFLPRILPGKWRNWAIPSDKWATISSSLESAGRRDRESQWVTWFSEPGLFWTSFAYV